MNWSLGHQRNGVHMHIGVPIWSSRVGIQRLLLYIQITGILDRCILDYPAASSIKHNKLELIEKSIRSIKWHVCNKCSTMSLL